MILAIHLWGAAVRADEWDDLYTQGKTALERGQWARAIRNLDQAITLKPHSDPHAVNSRNDLIEYLPYYYLGQAYFYSGADSTGFKLALANFGKELQQRKVQETAHLHHLQAIEGIARKLLELQRPSKPAPVVHLEPVLVSMLETMLDLIRAGHHTRADTLLATLRDRIPPDDRAMQVVEVIREWLQVQPAPPPDSSKPVPPDSARTAALADFHAGLKLFVRGDHGGASSEFESALKADPSLMDAADWIDLIKSLKVAPNPVAIDTAEPVVPRVLTGAPLVLITAPTATRSKTVRLAGKVKDEHGIDHIEFSLNGATLLDPSGRTRAVVPRNLEESEELLFDIDINLQKGENKVVVTAFDLDSPQHSTSQHFTIIRRNAVIETLAFKISLGAMLLLAVGGVLITKVIKDRIAFVNKYNPYVAGAPIQNEKMLFGREKLLQRIINTVHNNSLLLYGPRRIGKTSLQHELQRRLEGLDDPEFLYIPVLIDLQGTTEERFFRTLMEDIVEVCQSRAKTELSPALQGAKGDYSGRDFSRDLKKLLDSLRVTTPKKLKLVLLLDEVDVLNTYSDRVNQTLRSVFMKSFADNLVAILSGVYIKKDWASEGSPWYNFFTEIEILPLERQAAIDLIREPVQGIFSYEPEAIDRILAYSECKPYLIQRFCVYVVSRIIEGKRRRVTPGDVEAVREQALSLGEAPGGRTEAVMGMRGEAREGT